MKASRRGFLKFGAGGALMAPALARQAAAEVAGNALPLYAGGGPLQAGNAYGLSDSAFKMFAAARKLFVRDQVSPEAYEFRLRSCYSNTSSDHLPRAIRPAGSKHGGEWTDEAAAFAEKAWKDGYSASQISKALAKNKHGSFSRNAVIGKIHRMGLAGRAGCAAPRKRAIRQARAVALHGVSAPKIAEPYIPLPEPLTPTVGDVLELQPHQCKWPMEKGDGGGGGFSFCGREAEGVYCEAHAQRAAGVAPKKRSIKPDRVRTFDGFEMKVG